MTNTLPDLRLTIAEGMEALASTKTDYVKMWSLHFGAQTLRWCAERERPSYDEMAAELEAARESWEAAEDNVRDLIDSVRYAVSKWEHDDECPAGQLGARGNAVCDCALAERSKSVLDAVA